MKFWQSKYNSKIRVSQQELLEISTEVSLKYSPEIHSDFSELVLLPVDPFHVYTYWSIGERYPQISIDNDVLILRIYWQTAVPINALGGEQWLDIPVNSFPHRKKVLVPYDNAVYSAVIGRQTDEAGFSIYAFSNVVHTPRCGVNSIWNDKRVVPADIQENQNCDNQAEEGKEKMKDSMTRLEETKKFGKKTNREDFIFTLDSSDASGSGDASHAVDIGIGSSNYKLPKNLKKCQNTAF